MTFHFKHGNQAQPKKPAFKTPMTYNHGKDKAKPSPSRNELWREQLGLDDDPSQEREEEISDSEDEPEADQDQSKVSGMEFQILQREVEERTKERDECRLAVRMLKDKCKQYKEKLKKEEDYKKQHMNIMRKTHEAHLQEKQQSIKSQDDIINEHERKIAGLESRLTELGCSLDNVDNDDDRESSSGHSQLVEQLRRLQDEKADLTGHLLTAQAREEEVRRELMKERQQFHEELEKIELDNSDLQEEVIKLRNFQGLGNNTDTEKQVEKLESDNEAMRLEIEKLRSILPRVVKETVVVKITDEDKIKALEDNIKKLRRKITNLESEATNATHELNDTDVLYQEQLEKAIHDKVELSKQVGHLKSELEEVKSREPEVQTVEVKSDAHEKALADAKEEIEQLTSQIKALHQSCSQCSIELAKSRQHHKALEDEVEASQTLVKQIEEEYVLKLACLKRRNDELEAQRRSSVVELSEVSNLNRDLQTQVRELWPQIVAVSRDHRQLKEMCQTLPGIMNGMVTDVTKKVTYAIVNMSEHNKDLKRKYREEVTLRKKYHNELVELKGNIRVFARVRPKISEDGTGQQGQSVVMFDEIDDCLITIKNKGGRLQGFELDAVFQPASSQAEVFAEVSPLVISCIDGYNVCIFAYGQTGSGKTYTMEGVNSDPGINQRALIQLFREIESRGKDWSFTVTVSVMEIYNEMLRDLLSSDPTQKLEIKMLPNGGLHVPSLTIVEVKNVDDVNETFELGHLNRATAATNMNEHSSRSHALLRVNVVGYNKTLKTKAIGKLNLVDLAGSERVAKSGADGERLKEAQSINKSLAALGNVIQALKTKMPHIPYRDSKLTYLLQDSLGGDSKTLMIMQVSPVEKNVLETVCTLGFGQRCRKVELGKASKKIESINDNAETGAPKPSVNGTGTTPRRR
ncbi:kinesin-like protein KIFC3 isoform X2 [Lineus longissimus]|uniref:kinesin-like protein KIFC3 isoform X2 n=1 Tax=Lineus longissimus TaxID=88925 RepID=UPI002B4CB3C4